MKNIYSCLLALLALPSVALTKTTGISVPNIFPHYGSGGSNNVGNTQSRIIGQTYLVFDGSAFVPVDSTTYSYSFGRGGQLSTDDFNDNFVSFDDSHTYLFNPALNTYRSQFHRIQTFNETNQVKIYTCKTWRVSTGSWRDSARFLYNYNSDQTRLDSTIFQIKSGSNWLDHVIYRNVFDGANRVTEMNSTAYEMKFNYDASNNILERLDRIYPYPLPWTDDSRHIFTYNLTNQMTTYIVQEFDVIWKNFKKYEYTYSGPDVVTETEYDWDNNLWTAVRKHTFTYNTAHSKMSDVSEYWNATLGAFVNDVKLQWTYNSFGQPLTYYSQSWDQATSSWINTTNDFLFRYYYQTFNPASVNRFTPGSIEMVLYPQPAQQSINVSAELNKQESYSIAVYDIRGRVVKQLSGSGNSIQQNIPVQDLPAGTYFLKLSTSDKQQAKQFLVSH
jgi:hypothetical protein